MGNMKRSGEDGRVNSKCMNHGCLLPLLRRRITVRLQRINGDDEDEDLELTQVIVNTPSIEQSESRVHNKPEPPKRVNFKLEEVELSDPMSARLTLAKLFAILRDAYVCTMMSFAVKGGMGAMTMGGNINLRSAVPTVAVKRSVIST